MRALDAKLKRMADAKVAGRLKEEELRKRQAELRQRTRTVRISDERLMDRAHRALARHRDRAAAFEPPASLEELR